MVELTVTDREFTNTTRTVRRAMQVLSTFSSGQPELGVSEIARTIGLNKSTVYRLLSTMVQAGMLRENPATRRYALGYKILHLADALLRQLDIRALAQPYLRRLRDDSGETVTLEVLSDGTRVCLDQVESLQPTRTRLAQGKAYPLYTGAAGKAFLAAMSEEQVQAVLARASADGEYTLDQRALGRDLDKARGQGYAYTTGEMGPGAAAVAAVVRGPQGQPVATVTILGPASRFSQERIERFASLVKEAAEQISIELAEPDRAVQTL